MLHLQINTWPEFLNPMRLYFLFVITLFLFSGSPDSYANFDSDTQDSVGFKKIKGEWYFEHKIAKGETLYSLSRKFHVNIQEIKNVNHSSLKSLKIGQNLYIPISTDFTKIHRVKAGETLYSISKKHGVSLSNLKYWNDMIDDGLSANQKLVIFNLQLDGEPDQPMWSKSTDGNHMVKEGESLYSISRQYGTSVESLKEWNKLNDNDISPGQILRITEISDNSDQISKEDTIASEKVVNEPDLNEPYLYPEKNISSTEIYMPDTIIQVNFEKSEEQGMAELINGDETTKYLALHRTAPKGTILTVINELNDQVVFVRVIGVLPETGVNERVVVKISKAAWENLGAVNKKLRVKVSYVL